MAFDVTVLPKHWKEVTRLPFQKCSLCHQVAKRYQKQSLPTRISFLKVLFAFSNINPQLQPYSTENIDFSSALQSAFYFSVKTVYSLFSANQLSQGICTSNSLENSVVSVLNQIKALFQRELHCISQHCMYSSVYFFITHLFNCTSEQHLYLPLW